jgi:hypothetical protein
MFPHGNIVEYVMTDLEDRVLDAFKALDDRDRIADGWKPREAELAGAPLLDDWRVGTDGDALFFRGDVTGHPRLSDGEIVTSQVIAVDPHRAWIRTVSRWYRLGRQHGETAQ